MHFHYRPGRLGIFGSKKVNNNGSRETQPQKMGNDTEQFHDGVQVDI
jgi:hypothetical protein